MEFAIAIVRSQLRVKRHGKIVCAKFRTRHESNRVSHYFTRATKTQCRIEMEQFIWMILVSLRCRLFRCLMHGSSSGLATHRRSPHSPHISEANSCINFSFECFNHFRQTTRWYCQLNVYPYIILFVCHVRKYFTTVGYPRWHNFLFIHQHIIFERVAVVLAYGACVNGKTVRSTVTLNASTDVLIPCM